MKHKIRPRCYFDINIGCSPAGRIVLELFFDLCPKTCENFIKLCTGECGIGKTTNKRLHYLNTNFYLVMKGSMIQGGDFSSDGTGGESIFGGRFEDENFNVTHDKPFLLSMVNNGYNGNGSRFIITTKPAPYLNAKNVVFGHVISGENLVKSIEYLPVDSNNKPIVDATIVNCGVLIPVIRNKTKIVKESLSEQWSDVVLKKSKLHKSKITCKKVRELENKADGELQKCDNTVNVDSKNCVLFNRTVKDKCEIMYSPKRSKSPCNNVASKTCIVNYELNENIAKDVNENLSITCSRSKSSSNVSQNIVGDVCIRNGTTKNKEIQFGHQRNRIEIRKRSDESVHSFGKETRKRNYDFVNEIVDEQKIDSKKMSEVDNSNLEINEPKSKKPRISNSPEPNLYLKSKYDDSKNISSKEDRNFYEVHENNGKDKHMSLKEIQNKQDSVNEYGEINGSKAGQCESESIRSNVEVSLTISQKDNMDLDASLKTKEAPQYTEEKLKSEKNLNNEGFDNNEKIIYDYSDESDDSVVFIKKSEVERDPKKDTYNSRFYNEKRQSHTTGISRNREEFRRRGRQFSSRSISKSSVYERRHTRSPPAHLVAKWQNRRDRIMTRRSPKDRNRSRSKYSQNRYSTRYSRSPRISDRRYSSRYHRSPDVRARTPRVNKSSRWISRGSSTSSGTLDSSVSSEGSSVSNRPTRIDSDLSDSERKVNTQSWVDSSHRPPPASPRRRPLRDRKKIDKGRSRDSRSLSRHRSGSSSRSSSSWSGSRCGSSERHVISRRRRHGD